MFHLRTTLVKQSGLTSSAARFLEPLGLSRDQAVDLLGETCFDVYLNDVAYWRCVPANVWRYTNGGHQVIKKWLSYRERALLGRDHRSEEARYVTEMVRRIAALILMQPELDANYERVKADAWAWDSGVVGSQDGVVKR
jgi:long-subunit acyl-CoA synthetase (AMP-forming)